MENQKKSYEKIVSDLRKDLHEAIIAKDELKESVKQNQEGVVNRLREAIV